MARKLPEIDPDVEEKINGSQAARLIGIDPSTLARWRAENRGPAFDQPPGGRPRYKRADVLAFIQNSRRRGEGAA